MDGWTESIAITAKVVVVVVVVKIETDDVAALILR